VYQLRGVRAYATGDVHGRADLLAHLFAGINEDSAAYPVEMFRRAGDSRVLRIGTVHRQTGTVGTRGGAQSRFAGQPSPLSREPTQLIRLRRLLFRARLGIPRSHQQEQDLPWIREDFLLHAESSEGEDRTFILTSVDKAALAYTIIKPAPVRQPQRQGDLLGARRHVISETPPDPEGARTNSPCLRT
jgi:hypothetical protein